MEEKTKRVLAMYDVRGIQNYIFRTPQVKDAIGASEIVEDIIFEALQFALTELGISDDDANLKWHNEQGPLNFAMNEIQKVQLLYIGGGNGLLICESRNLCREINRHMAKYVMEHTYSLQLAAAMVDIEGNYEEDHHKLIEEMDRVKAQMLISKPLGALPVMEVEVKTGYPAIASSKEKIGTESVLKKQKEQKSRANTDIQLKIFDNYTTKKGTDSTIAVVHIDGNNMGLRIRELMEVEGMTDYDAAVNRMRRISFNITQSYKTVFEQMRDFFNENSGDQEEFKNKKTDNFVLEILVAGDDITYVCNGKIALATVDYFCQNISKYKEYSLAKGIYNEAEKLKKYSFSACAGISYIGSHFPFYVGYEVARECSENAKHFAKNPDYCNCEDNRVGSWVDFHICKNIQAQNLADMRTREYLTSHKEQLLRRPYFICTGEKDWPVKKTDSRSLSSLEKNILYFQNKKNIPRTFSKNLRNIYSQGQIQADMLLAFLESRNWKMPDGSNELYEIEEDEEKDTALPVAKWFDSLEMMDYYIDLERIEGGE